MNLKEFFSYITNQLKFWFIIKEWEYGLHLRNGKVKRQLKEGFYFKIPFLDFIYSQPKRVQDIVLSQINYTTACGDGITASVALFFKIDNILKYYNGYAEPNSVIANKASSLINKYFLETNYKDFKKEDLEENLFSGLSLIENKGFYFESVSLTTFSNARTYRIIKDNLYSQSKNQLDTQLF